MEGHTLSQVRIGIGIGKGKANPLFYQSAYHLASHSQKALWLQQCLHFGVSFHAYDINLYSRTLEKRACKPSMSIASRYCFF